MSRNTRFLTLCSLAAIGVSLSACSSLPSASSLWPFGGDDKRDIAETIEINQPDLPTTTQAIDLAAAQTALRTNAPKTMEDSVALMNDQGVKVFGLTGDAPREALPSANAPRGFDVNPNVEIFPLDGGVHQPAMNQPSFAPRAYTPQTTPVPHQAHAANHGDVVYFDHDSVALDRNDLAVIRRVAQNFRASGKSVLSVEGYASVRSSLQSSQQRHMANMKVSMERAFAVANALVQAGVPATAVKTAAWGDAQTASGAESAARRVEIIAQ